MIQHIESYLGKMEGGWGEVNGKSAQVGLFRNQPQPHINSYLTIGLSKESLKLKKEKLVRQEFIFSMYERFEDKSKEISSTLISLADHVSQTNRGLLRGEVIGPGSPIIKDTKLVGVYCSIPVFFEESFYVVDDVMPPIVFVWLIGLTAGEINFVNDHGYNTFEDHLQSHNVDFWDIYRKSLFD